MYSDRSRELYTLPLLISLVAIPTGVWVSCALNCLVGVTGFSVGKMLMVRGSWWWKSLAERFRTPGHQRPRLGGALPRFNPSLPFNGHKEDNDEKTFLIDISQYSIGLVLRIVQEHKLPFFVCFNPSSTHRGGV